MIDQTTILLAVHETLSLGQKMTDMLDSLNRTTLPLDKETVTLAFESAKGIIELQDKAIRALAEENSKMVDLIESMIAKLAK